MQSRHESIVMRYTGVEDIGIAINVLVQGPGVDLPAILAMIVDSINLASEPSHGGVFILFQSTIEFV